MWESGYSSLPVIFYDEAVQGEASWTPLLCKWCFLSRKIVLSLLTSPPHAPNTDSWAQRRGLMLNIMSDSEVSGFCVLDTMACSTTCSLVCTPGGWLVSKRNAARMLGLACYNQEVLLMNMEPSQNFNVRKDRSVIRMDQENNTPLYHIGTQTKTWMFSKPRNWTIT